MRASAPPSSQTAAIDDSNEVSGPPLHRLPLREPSSGHEGEPPLLRNATSHADRHGHGCPSAPAIQHSGGVDLAVALHS
jgi:hypothetical protein